MKKILSFVLLSFVLFFLIGCGDYKTEVIQFKQFSFDFRTDGIVYNQISWRNIDSNNLWKWLFSVYIAEESGFLEEIDGEELTKIPYYNSLLLSNISVPDWTKLQDFIDLNINKTSIALEKYNNSSQEEISFDCIGTEIVGILEEFQSSLVAKEILYFGQYFFIYKWEVYVFSFSSEIEDERDYFVSSLKTMKCG